MDARTSDSGPDVFPRPPALTWRRHRGIARRSLSALILVGLLALTIITVTRGQDVYEQEDMDQINRRGLEQIDRINHALELAGKIFLGIGAALLAIVALKILSPVRIYDNTRDRHLRKAVRGVDDLLQKVQKEAEATSTEAKEEAPEEGVLAGMMEVAEFSEAEQVPSYVLTVNDLMLDNIRATLKKLRRFTAGDAQRYREYLFSVIKGIKTLTEQSSEAGIASGLAVDLKEYFRDDKRCRAWRRLLRRFARKGRYQETAQSFLLFIRDIREGRPLAATPEQTTVTADTVTVSSVTKAPAIPGSLSEETLPAVQQAAQAEAKNLCALIRTGLPADPAHAWQFELVQRQQQVHVRDEAQQIFRVFLNCERKALHQMTKIKMLPCRTWKHVLHMLGVETAVQLHNRIENRLLTIQEIIVLQKAFLQTFAKRESLVRVYGHDADAALMMDVHLPEIRRAALVLLRESHQTEPKRFARATEELNEEETPRHNEVSRLIEHYVNGGHNPPGIDQEARETSGS
ncbi:MAG: hypothetical protein JW741_20230 [Sedimentisphaerales bacterium]|nr:hypothetical protein [Sedimentisphaerales bacterium]